MQQWWRSHNFRVIRLVKVCRWTGQSQNLHYSFIRSFFCNSKRNGHIATECKLFTADRFDGLFGVILNGTIKQVLCSHSNKEHQYFSLSWVVCRWCPGQVHTFKISRRKLQSSSLAEVASTEFDNQASTEMVASNQSWSVYVAQTPAT